MEKADFVSNFLYHLRLQVLFQVWATKSPVPVVRDMSAVHNFTYTNETVEWRHQNAQHAILFQ